MTSRKNLAVILTTVLGIFTINIHARSWDIAIAIGREVEFLAQNQTIIGQAKLAEAVTLSGVAYDDITRTMYFSDVSNKNISIFSNDLEDKNFTLKPLLKKQSKSYILALAFDIKSRTLFWSDALQGVIMKMHVSEDGLPEEPTILHNLTYQSPRGIALDVCNSHIYWVNSNNTNPSIEKSNLDGSNRVTVIKEDLYEPLAVAIDHSNKKLYWIDDAEGLRIKIERSNLDGSERELLVHPKRHQPVYLALDHNSIYWSDLVHRAVWTIPKDAKFDEPKMFRSYQSTHDADPAGIVTRDNVGKVECPVNTNVTQNTNPTNLSLDERSYNNLITSTEESELTTETSKHCLNDGHVDEKEGTCQCRLGFTGPYCEMNLCHNYCFQGNCSINSDGLPTCKCNNAFIGPRCETDLCKDYCLHDGQCSVQDEKPVCKCKYSEGSRCEILGNTAELCEIICATERVPTSIVTAHCRCPEKNRLAQMVIAKEENEYSTWLPIFGAVVGVLILVIAVLSFYVNKFRKRPRIKKRFVVSKGGVTPLTSRPQLPDNQCEITIENCCNMNICETPCFEPKLCVAASGANVSKKEEKNSLLDNMEENSW